VSSPDRPPAPDLVSGEGVALQLPRAGIGSRLVATLIDVVIQVIALVVLILVTAVLAGGSDTAAAAALIITEAVLVIAGYPILTEWLNHGRTVGKAALGLRVVRDDGGPISFRQALVRGLSSLVLEKPGIAFPITTSIGLLTALFSSRSKRLGDLMAGTFVIYERGGPQRSIAPGRESARTAASRDRAAATARNAHAARPDDGAGRTPTAGRPECRRTADVPSAGRAATRASSPGGRTGVRPARVSESALRAPHLASGTCCAS
jgi:uncharacterized RDD family membrane protein YckC